MYSSCIQSFQPMNNQKKFFYFLLIVFTTCFNVHLLAQRGEVPHNLSSVKVDELSDDQIKQMLKQARDKGMTEHELEALAMAKGMPGGEIQKLRQRIMLLQNNSQSQNQQAVGTVTRKQNKGVEAGEDFSFFSELVPITEKDTLLMKVFGHALFNNQKLTFEPNLNIPTPPNYQLGPGDELIVEIWGASQENIRVTVNPEGYIKMNNLAPVYVTGLTVEAASKRIIERLSGIYSGLRSRDGQKPNTYAMVTLGNVRSIQVNLVGEVVLPGTYTLPSLATVFNALYASGGPNINGSFRNIQVIRNNKVVTTLDVYDFLLGGDQKANIILQDQDLIHVRPFDNRIEIKGEVKRNGFYEAKSSETVKDIIRFAGGLYR